MTTIYTERLDDRQRVAHTARLFGLDFPLRLEPTVFAMAGRLSGEYTGGHWDFFALCNGGFYMAPSLPTRFNVRSENGFEGAVSPDAFGLIVCLYAYSQLSFGEGRFAKVCGEHFHLLRALALDHAEARAIMAAVD